MATETERRQAMHAAKMKLREASINRALALKDEGLSNAEVAEKMDIPEAAVRWLVKESNG
jgi:orotate phosphoribosyltransferase-like protein